MLAPFAVTEKPHASRPSGAGRIRRLVVGTSRGRGGIDRFVELVTYYAGYRPAHTKEELLPDGAVEIVVDLADTPKKLYDRDDHGRWVGMRKAWISGMRRSWLVVEAAPGAEMAIIRFRLGGAFPVLGFAWR